MDFAAAELAVGPGGRKLLWGIELQVASGQAVVVHGASGTGKSYLLRSVAWDVPPLNGQLRLGDRDAAQWGRNEWRKRVCLVPQRPSLFPGTVEDNLRFAERLLRRAPRSRARLEDEVRSLGLPGPLLDVDAQQLAAGERLRVALLRALALTPPLLLLDEPTAHLEEREAYLTERLLRRRLAEGRMALLMVSHDPGQALRLGATARATAEWAN